MALTLLILCFISIFLSIGAFQSQATGKKEVLLITVLVFSTLVVFITEILSILHCFNFQSILISWSIVLIGSLLYLYLKKEKLAVFTGNLSQNIYNVFKSLSIFEKILLGSVSVILLLIFAQGIIYPPNNWDSMTYHMARITSWVSHQSVAYYPTHVVRQLYEPPFAEYLIAHIAILSKGDYFANPVQLFFLLLTVVGIVLILEEFGLNRSYKVIAVVLAVTIPEVVLEASSTQNDIVVSFFIIAACCFALRAVKSGRFSDHLFLGLAVGLGILTKGTAYIYLAPVLLFWGIGSLVCLFRTRNYNYLIFPLMVAVLSISINAGQYYRNYNYSKNVLGTDKEEGKTYANQKMSAGIFLSSVIKNAGMHFSLMYAKPVAKVSTKVVYELHAIAGTDINDPAVNYRNNIYIINSGVTDEDGGPNMIHFILIAAAFVILGWGIIKGNREFIVTTLLAIMILQVVFFCAYLKWQPWVSRLHVPMFLLSVPLVCYALSISKLFKKIVYIITPVLLVYALLVVFHNIRRSYSNTMFNSRYQNYFAGNPLVYDEYNAVYTAISQSGAKNIGLLFGVDDWEYPLFKDSFSRHINPFYIGVDNVSKSLPQTVPTLDYIISTTTNHPFIDFNGKRFYNQSTGNKYLFLYR
ncbi:Dolichyl-phosphate-mannose-protein mannosyltransferase [Mucilaginibacter mallensis]|uniref:Dolichyl-phosphate-mannose-protein mannosyltransferase n=1 Tax=Mucilaginibacter mallensis TaxID=652787 RepID=A0A1H1MK21_MUCMA|nr:glycosyltransferase family 39 protein [Mucilaginibacter mallensis]SDR87098.1 Dolichyl-phosphate-mannose-protein mannosyltransferase [Mucilaginibacter mallensis]